MQSYRGVIIISLLIFIFPDSNAQPYRGRSHRKKMNVIDITYGGTGLLLSVNYSRKFYIRPDQFINTSAGAGTFIGVSGISLPHQVTWNYGRWKNFLEAGIGGSYWKGISYSYSLSPVFGYRRELFNDFVVRIYFNPLFRIAGEYFYREYSIVPYGGISLGYSF